MSNMLLDKEITNGLMKVGGAILKEHFFFDEDALNQFYFTYADLINTDYMNLTKNANDDFKLIMINDHHARKEFTATFCGFHLAKSLFELHFSDQEIEHFQNLLTKYVKVVEHD